MVVWSVLVLEGDLHVHPLALLHFHILVIISCNNYTIIIIMKSMLQFYTVFYVILFLL